MNLEDTLREALQADAAELVPVGPGPDDARRRAHRRRRRMQAGVVSLSAVALVGASLAIVDSRSSGQGPRVQAQPAASHPTPDLAWRAVDGTVLYDTEHFTTSDGVTYALSTAPGAPPTENGVTAQELYSTRNGVDWTQTPLGAAPWVADLTASSGVLYAVGTAPGSQGGIDYELKTSSDGGTNWDDKPIPVSFAPPSASVSLNRVTSVKLARGPHTTVVIASASFTPDYSSVIGNAAAKPAANGVQILDMSDCRKTTDPAPRICEPKVKDTRPWSDFGISDPAALHQQQALVRDDGGDWQTFTMTPDDGAWLQDVAATSKGFLIAESVPTGAAKADSERLLSSTDGRAWTPLATVPAVDSVSISGDRVIGIDSSTSTVFTSNDAGETWSQGTTPSSVVGDTSVAPFAIMSDAGPLGYTVVVQAVDPAQPSGKPTGDTYLLYSADGSEWKATDLANVGAPADGSVASAHIGADHIDVTFQAPAARSGNAVTSWKLTTLVGTPKA